MLASLGSLHVSVACWWPDDELRFAGARGAGGTSTVTVFEEALSLSPRRAFTR